MWGHPVLLPDIYQLCGDWYLYPPHAVIFLIPIGNMYRAPKWCNWLRLGSPPVVPIAIIKLSCGGSIAHTTHRDITYRVQHEVITYRLYSVRIRITRT